jgi:hypothetical protein
MLGSLYTNYVEHLVHVQFAASGCLEPFHHGGELLLCYVDGQVSALGTRKSGPTGC